MVLVDSSVWIAYFNGVPVWQTDRLDALLGETVVLAGDLVLMEVLQGFRYDSHFLRARALLLELETVELAGVDVALEAAQHYRSLRKLGITVRKTIDVLIASACIRNGWTLLHRDRDFEPFIPLGLNVVTQ